MDYQEIAFHTTPAINDGIDIETLYESRVNVRLSQSMMFVLSGSHRDRTSATESRTYTGLVARAGISHAF
jgi:hypothetical protein